MKIKKILALLLALVMSLCFLTACGGNSGVNDNTQAGDVSTDSGNTTAPDNGDVENDGTYIAIISKGWQHQFWQVVYQGAEDAAAEYGVTITFDGPASESDIADQIDMLNAAMANNPDAIALAALDTESVTSQLLSCKENGIPVVGFDSGVPNAPEGTIYATAATNNYNMGVMCADAMWETEKFQSALDAATTDEPVVIAVLAQDATSASVVDRAQGFIDAIYKHCETQYAGSVAITGHDKFAKDCANDMIVNIRVVVPASTDTVDCQTAAQGIFGTKNLIGIVSTTDGTGGSILSVTNDGTDLDPSNGKFSHVTVAAMGAGTDQKNAVRNQYFIGSGQQDAYQIGYQAVELCVKALNGEKISDVDTGCQWATHENMDDPDIAALMYD